MNISSGIKLIVTGIIATSFSSCSVLEKVYIKFHPKWNTINYFREDSSVLTVSQQIGYAESDGYDGGYLKNLHIELIDTVLHRNIDVEDTNFLLAKYEIFSVWRFEPNDYKITGWINFKKIRPNKIVVKENILVQEQDRLPVKFKGVRRFKPDKQRFKRSRN